MADTKITALAAIGANPINVATFPIPMVDLLDTSMAASGTTKKVTVNQILGAGGTATLASATITGDLTVRTNKLAVTSTGVGIGTASPSVAADVIGSSAGATLEVLRLQNSGSGINTKTRLNFYAASTNYGAITGGFGASSPEFIFDINTSSGAFIWNNFGSEAMRLNSTGLGVGVTSPDFKFAVNGTQAVPATTGSATDNGSLRIGAPGTNLVIDTGVTAAGAVYGWIQARSRTDYSSNYNLVLQPNGGNVGIGVSPSYRLDINGTLRISNFGIIRFDTGTNTGFIDYNDTRLQLHAGSLPMYFVAGNTLKMTLDTSGNLGIGVSTFGTSAARVLSIGTVTEPTTGPTGTVQFFSSTRSANNTIPAIFCEGSGVTNAAITNTTVTNKIAIKVNGTIYYLLATTSAV